MQQNNSNLSRKQLANLARIRKWRAVPGNREKERERLRLLYLSKREEWKQRSRKWYAANREHARKTARESRKEWTAEQRESEQKRLAEWIECNEDRYAEAKRRWDIEHPEIREAWRRNHPDNIAAYIENRRAFLRGRRGKVTPADIDERYARQNGKCAACGRDLNGKFERDHIMPLHLGGEHEPANIQLLCRRCNRSKGHKHPDRWREELKRKE